jgi:hypothetical protein
MSFRHANDSKPVTRSLRMLSLLFLAPLTVSCSEPASTAQAGEVAVWAIEAKKLSPSSTSFVAVVTGLSCNSGVPHVIQQPTIAKTELAITVTFTVEPPSPGFHTCQGVLGDEYSVDLGEPIGNRQLIDSACVEGEAASTSFCMNGPVRWTPEIVATTMVSLTTTTPGSGLT